LRIDRALLGICAVALAACADAPPPAAPPAMKSASSLTGTRWMGVVAPDADHHTIPRLEFVAAGRLSGYTGCNMLSGAWTMDGAEVRVASLVMTKRMCVGPEGETEKRFLAAMRAGARGRREGDRLVFTGPRGERFEFVEAAAT
jgi:heat shock protein HslJ